MKIVEEALSLFAVNKFDEALGVLKKIKNPDLLMQKRVDILKAAIFLKTGKITESLKILDSINQAEKHYEDQRINLIGVALRAQGKSKEALEVLERGYKEYPTSLDLAHNLAVTATDLAEFDKAIEAENAAMKINPKFPEIYRNLGRIYITKRDVENAKKTFHALDKLDPGCEDVEVGLGAIALIENNPKKAIPHFEKAILLNPKGGPSWANLGICYKFLGNFAKAKMCLEKAMLNDPGQVEHRWNMALLQLTIGEMADGWFNYECRYDPGRISSDRVIMPKTSLPMLSLNDSVKDKTIILVQEQGFGDTFQFYRFSRELKNEGASRVVAIVAPELNDVVRTIPWIDEAHHEVNGDLSLADYWVFPMSLPYRYGVKNEDSVPRPIPYISIDEGKKKLWAKTFESLNPKKIRVGLVWAGRETHTNDKNRSMRLSDFNVLEKFSDQVEFVSLQKGKREADEKDPNWQITYCGEKIETFMDSAAIMANLDLLISIDSAPVHLAGAIGAPVWALIPFIFDFRWMENREDSPWYPSVRLFRQETNEEGWGPVVNRLCSALEKFIKDRPARWKPSIFNYEDHVKKTTTYAGVTLWLHSAFRYHLEGNIEKAQELYQLVRKYDPNNINATRNLAVLLRTSGNINEAIDLYRFGENASFEDPDFYVNYANLLSQLGQWAAALERIDKALGFNPKNIKALILGSSCCEKLGLTEKALQLLLLAQSIEWSLEHEIKICSFMLLLGQFDEAIEKAENLLESYSHICEVQILAAQTYQAKDKDGKAFKAYDLAVKINADHPDIYSNRAILKAKTGNILEAIEDARKAISILPQNPEFHFQLATFLLTAGQYHEGWMEYEWRMHPQRTALRRVLMPVFNGASLWQGEPLQGRTILILPEQGFGDQIQFIRYAKWLKELGARVLVGAQSPLERLLKSCPWIDQVIADGQSFSADYWVFPMSLPKLASTELTTIPAETPYIFSEKEKVEQWLKWLNKKGIFRNKPIIGLCWQGDDRHVQDRKRSLPLDALKDLLHLHQYQFIGITRNQNASTSYELGGITLHNAGPDIEDFSDTAGLLSNIDLLISIDSAPVHLAGAMNKPCWVLLDNFADFRWMLDRKSSPWYPTLSLYRKENGIDWVDVIVRVANDLERGYNSIEK